MCFSLGVAVEYCLHPLWGAVPAGLFLEISAIKCVVQWEENKQGSFYVSDSASAREGCRGASLTSIDGLTFL